MKQKIKTLSSLKKRLKCSANKKYLHRHSGTSHNNSAKSSKCKRRLHRTAIVDKTRAKAIKKLVPYL